MRYTDHLAKRLVATITGPMWHGPAVNDLLQDVTAADALARPLAHAHSIWELVHHMTVWARVPLERIEGVVRTHMTDAEDWPPAPVGDAANDEAWTAAQRALLEAYGALAMRARTLRDDELAAFVPHHDYTVATMLDGVVEHGTYHAGQVALVKKALRAHR